MYYLKCEKCGHYNSVISEYMVYCGKCKIHLPNNYIDWVSKNPNKNFDDFKQLVCISQSDVPTQNTTVVKPPKRSEASSSVPPKRRKRKLTKSQLIGIIVGAIVAAVFTQIGKYAATELKEFIQMRKIESVEFAAPDTTNWNSFTCDKANFEMLFPQTPMELSQDVEVENGELRVVMYMYEPELGADANLLYGASFTIYPDMIDSDEMSGEQLEAFFENSIGGTVTGMEGRLLSTYVIDYNGYPGREINVEIKNGMAVAKVRSYLVKNTMYMLQVIYPAKHSFNTSVNYFLDSFKLKGV
ncbi:hypothetical protein INQ51_00180 [Maribellus sp. CM-23]|uniref:hypothetical protein n=1 Tax=Maribellus sp. CM-23 TaxID=2781026 RepID=UPI001F42AF28|nr:hypothetical protein [Maribellus sp. CM-23]MCE4562709.1 hypothetical protein [Maribellus sp. CM-23]